MTKSEKVQTWDETANVAKFFGFEAIKPPTINKQDFDCTKNFDQKTHPEEKACLIRNYFDNKLWSGVQPLMYFIEKPFPGSKEHKRPQRLENALYILGSNKSVCECLSIQTTVSILESVGYKDVVLRLNSIGDKESNADFTRKLTAHIRKNFNSYPSELKQDLKKDVFNIFKKPKEYQQFIDECPKSIDFLSENSRKHFKEVLEFLEIMEIAYKIDPTLIGDPQYSSETIFAIDSAKDDENLCYGFRFNRMAKKMGHKKEVACVYTNISVKTKKSIKKVKLKNQSPKAYLVQFGPEAKVKSFLILEELYKSGVYISHAIAKDKLAGQINIAEGSDIPYILLLGQKEALENSVVIRNNSNRAQEIVLIPDIGKRLKEL